MPYGTLPPVKLANSDESIPGFPVVIPNPPKQAVLRLPTDAELLDYLSAQKSIYRDLGRRQSESEDVPTPIADLKLFRAIRIDNGEDDWDDAEAKYAIDTITRHRVSSCERDGDTYVVTLGTLFGECRHVVSIPFQKDMAEYRRGMFKSRDLPHGIEERRFPPEVPVKLYDKISRNVEGYADGYGVPPHHKRTVVNEVMLALSLLDPSLDPNS